MTVASRCGPFVFRRTLRSNSRHTGKTAIRTARAVCIFAAAAVTSGAAPADNGTVVVREQRTESPYVAYAQVRPVATVSMQAMATGLIRDLSALPGESVRAGQTLGSLGGPEFDAALARTKADVDSAHANLSAAGKLLSAYRRQVAAHLVTAQQVARAESDVTDAKGALAAASARLGALQSSGQLLSPISGKVLGVNVAVGQRVSVGDAILELESPDHLWLQAAFYGNDAREIGPGMSGTFLPNTRERPVRVRVRAVSASLRPDGGRVVDLVPERAAPGWQDGDFGTVTIDGAPQSLVSVPTRALILDRGKWWVVVRTNHEDHPQEVVPGQSRGWDTFIVRGLQPGATVVVENAYLRFHHGIAEQYQPPD